MVDRDKFTVHPNILSSITVFVMELDGERRMKIRQEEGRRRISSRSTWSWTA